MQSKFKRIVSSTTKQNDKKAITIEPRSYEELLHIFGVDNYTLEDYKADVCRKDYPKLVKEFLKEVLEEVKNGN